MIRMITENTIYSVAYCQQGQLVCAMVKDI